MTFRVVVPSAVELQVRSIDAWWRANRLAAPRLFIEELAAAFEMLASVPHAGRRYDHAALPSVRRLFLRTTRYHVYYQIRADEVVVLSVWSSVRGSGPTLA